MEKKRKIDALLQGAGKAAKDAFDSAIHAADQNDDGKFDFSDVSIIAGSVSDAVKKGTQAIKESADEKVRLYELKNLQPIFVDALSDSEFLMPKFIRIVEREKKYLDKAVCQGSIGYNSEQNGVHLVNLFRDSLDVYGLSFYPDSDSEFYYVDPSDRDKYISLDDYFSYLKIARINELKKIAQDLGAKHFKVTYKEEKTSFSEKKVKGNIKAAVKADAEHHAMEKQYSTVEIAAEMNFPGHAPIKPTLKYMQRDPSIQTLISMRMNADSPLMNEKYLLQLSTSSGMKENDAIKIDAVLKGMKCSGNTTVSSEAKNESRRYLEYEIDF